MNAPITIAASGELDTSLFMAGIVPGLLPRRGADRARRLHRVSRRPSTRGICADRRGASRSPSTRSVGIDHDPDHHRRHPRSAIFTAIEAGAVACLWAFFVTMFIYRDYRWRDLPTLVHRTLQDRRHGDDA